ncbi:phosphopantetheine-binding protein [Kitasatospora phosalacinea]|uniref:phosphopantetheine-binding protein n=1 Tax=Kitasatospora phosalacinea TaxID=2065 RepID=UPI0035DD41CC
MDPRFVELLATYLRFLGGRELTPGSALRDLGLDSMQAVELLFAIEDAFEVTLPEEALNDTTFATAGSLWATVSSVIDGQSLAPDLA